MGAIEYKMWIDGKSATQKQLDSVDEIVVDQAVDRAWEAHIKVPVCVNDKGKWDGEGEAWMKTFTPVRIEVNGGNGKFVPVIDGPVVALNSSRSAEPGRSVVTIVVHDDSALLNRETKVDVQRGKTDGDLARQIFSNANLKPQIDDTAPQPNSTSDAAVQTLTPMAYLRELVRRHPGWHAYVLPGEKPGKSIGCFKKFPTDTDGLPEMVLLGADRNIGTFNVNHNGQTACSTIGATLAIDHGRVVYTTSSVTEPTLMGNAAPSASGAPPATCRVRPGVSDRVDLEEVTKGATANAALSLEATGSIVPFCYPAVLSPYRWVLVKISDSQFSSKYLITRVTHMLTHSLYTQTFTMRGNGVTVAAGGSPAGPQASANLGISINLQLSIV